MRRAYWWLSGCLMGCGALGCAGKSAPAGDGDGDSGATGGVGDDPVGGSASDSGGSTSDGGTNTSMGGQGGNDAPGSGGSENGIFGGKNCDATQVLVKIAPPDCGAGQIPEVVNGNWGQCVPLMECGCESPGSQLQCGDGLSYVCYSNHRCGDLL